MSISVRCREKIDLTFNKERIGDGRVNVTKSPGGRLAWEKAEGLLCIGEKRRE